MKLADCTRPEKWQHFIPLPRAGLHALQCDQFDGEVMTRMKLVWRGLTCGLVALAAVAAVQAEPTGDLVSVVYLRPISNTPQAAAILQVTPASLCSTDTYTIVLSEPGGREMYAAALAAMVSGKKIRIEVFNATGCTGWATRLQSLYLVN